MKTIIILIGISALSIGAIAKSGGGSHSVRGHVTKNGTYVQPHHATNPNNSKHDNWSSKPNTNPYTGQAGTKDQNKP